MTSDLDKAQQDLEEAIFEGQSDAIDHAFVRGADPLAFPRHVLKDRHPPWANGVVSSKVWNSFVNEPCFGRPNPGDVSPLGLILLGPRPSSLISTIHLAMESIKGRSFSEPPLIVRANGKAPGMDLWEFLGHRASMLNWNSMRTEGADFIHAKIFDAMGVDSAKVRAGLGELAHQSLRLSGEQLGKALAGDESQNTHQTLGFKVFANLVCRGIDVDMERLPHQSIEFGTHVPLLTSAVYHGEASRAPESRDVLMRRLIDLGAPVNATSAKSWQTPLMAAAYRADIRAMGILIEGGADLFAKDNRNWTARSFAKSHGKNANGFNAVSFIDAAIAQHHVKNALSQVLHKQVCTA